MKWKQDEEESWKHNYMEHKGGLEGWELRRTKYYKQMIKNIDTEKGICLAFFDLEYGINNKLKTSIETQNITSEQVTYGIKEFLGSG